MLAKRIIPCLDVKDGRVVKGVKFLNLKDAGDPVEQAKFYEQAGADELVFLDITASAEKRKTMVELARRTADRVCMPFTLGGGLSSLEDVRAILKAGADKVSLNTAVLLEPGLIDRASARFGNQCIVVAIDAKRTPARPPACRQAGQAGGGAGTTDDGRRTTENEKQKTDLSSDLRPPSSEQKWEAYIYGGRTPTGRDAVEWAREAEERGAGEILLTSMDRDGTRDGYDLELTRAVSRTVNIPVIASGGAGKLEDLYQALTAGEAQAVLAASIFHFRSNSIEEVKEYLWERGVEVRL